MRRVLLVLVVSLTTAPLLAGCLDSGRPPADDAVVEEPGLVPVQERRLLPYATDGAWSTTLVAGTLATLPVESVFVDVALPLEEGVAAATGARVHMGLWRPDVPAGTRVPVIADVGPYYGDGDVPATEPADRLGRFLIENFVPHGYAVAQVSVFGSGQSGHCMDLMGRSEQLGIDAAVTWLGEQDWSSGAVGLIGRSYDGSTPWEAATFGNPHLETIVPISGLVGMHELMWRNGSAEQRAPTMHNRVYGQFGIDGDAGDVENLCKDYLLGPAQGAAAYVTGDHVAPEANDYWAERAFLERVLVNYDGSVYLIHGLQDWNVDPHMAFPTFRRVQEAGLEAKGLFGQWAHNYPDRLEEHEECDGLPRCHAPGSVRHDWAQDLLEWFDHYLKGTGPKPALHVEVQDDQGAWRIEATYPPLDAAWVELPLAEATPAGPGLVAPSTGSPLEPDASSRWTWAGAGGPDGLRIAGHVRLPLGVVPAGAGGQVFAELRDATADRRLGHAIMDLRYAAGDGQMRPVAPGQPLVAHLEFQAMDVVVPPGADLELRLAGTGEGYRPSAVSAPVAVEGGTLRLPTVARGADAFFFPPGQQPS